MRIYPTSPDYVRDGRMGICLMPSHPAPLCSVKLRNMLIPFQKNVLKNNWEYGMRSGEMLMIFGSNWCLKL